jgi:hypothetical protein
MLRIQRSVNGEVVFTMSGQIDAESIVELEAVINSEAKGLRIVLDLKDLTLANEDAITFLVRCEANRITLKNCPAYVREWIHCKTASRLMARTDQTNERSHDNVDTGKLGTCSGGSYS